jgi:hypothetical protein
MNAVITALFTAILEALVRMYQFSREAVDATSYPARMRTVGARVRTWVQQSRADSGVKPDPNRPRLPDKDLPSGGG